jgi:hypothetical protein
MLAPERRKFGNHFLCLLLTAIGTNGIFSFEGHGLQKNEILAAGFTHIFIEWHNYELLLNGYGKLAFATLSGPENV